MDMKIKMFQVLGVVFIATRRIFLRIFEGKITVKTIILVANEHYT